MDDDFDDFGGDFDVDENDLFLEEDGNMGGGGVEIDCAQFTSRGPVQPSDGILFADGDTSAIAASTGSHGPCDAVPAPKIQDLFPKADPDTVPIIVGIIAQGKIGEGIDIRALSCATRNVEFIPRRQSPAATMRLHAPSAVVVVRTSGHMTIIGASSISEARQATELAARIIRKALGLTFCTVQHRVRSLMARFNVGHPIRLEDLAQHEGVFCSYEPDRFSGCIIRLSGNSHDNRWQVSCTVFVTGKVSMVGARSQEELRDAFYTLLPILAPYAKK